MTARWLAFAIWAVVAATAVFWGSRLFVAAPPSPAHARAADDGRPPPADVSRVLGREAVVAAPSAPVVAADSRFKLVGVAAPRAAGSATGVALIAIDGKPARAFRVGTAIDAGLVLQSVQPRAAMLGPRGEAPQLRLELPALPPPATGTPAGVGGALHDGNFAPPALPGMPSAPGAAMLPRPAFSPPPSAATPPPAAVPGLLPGMPPPVPPQGDIQQQSN